MFELDLVVSRACGDQDVDSRDRDTGGTRASCEIIGGTPNYNIDSCARRSESTDRQGRSTRLRIAIEKKCLEK
jgi:hypothetical protein